MRVMSKIFLSFFFFISLKSWSQNKYNLILNPSFEEYNFCPNPNKIDKVNFWYVTTNDPTFYQVYFNACITNNCCKVPQNIFGLGYQSPRTGNAYSGGYLMAGYGGNIRNYATGVIKNGLVNNKLYYVEFFVNLVNAADYATNNISLLFTNTIPSQPANGAHIAANPHITNFGNPIIKDTLNWVKVSGIYKANGSERFVTIGNFKSDIETDTSNCNFPIGSKWGEYNLDDVSVIPLDSMCLKAEAGTDKNIALGDSTFIGSYTNGIDSLLWLQNGTIKIDSTKPGFFVSPTTNTFYVLQQTINGCTTRDTVNVNVSLMPLRFTSFNFISKNGKSVELSWNTADEINVSHFNLQRSINGIHFSTIATAKAKNQSLNEYSIIDYNLPLTVDNKLYYKIEAIDFDGRKTYSNIKQIILNNLNDKQLIVFPNPAKDFINITSKEKIKEVKLFNSFGQLVKQQFLNLPTNSLLWGFVEAKGIYIIQITTTHNQIITQKIVLN